MSGIKIDWDAFEERAAIAEYDGGLSRFEAETLAARAQGLERWQVMEEANANKLGNPGQARDHSQAAQRVAENDLPGVQPRAEEENGPMPVRHVQAGRDRLELLALRAQGGSIL